MKRIFRAVAAPDSFKGSICAADAAYAIKKGMESVNSEDAMFEVLALPVADGGEGTLDALREQYEIRSASVTGPDGKKIIAEYGVSADTALIEMASAAGLTIIPRETRSAARTTTYGVGELIRHAYADGCRKIMLTVGGSATNDCGCGMFSALGAVFYDKNDVSFVPTGATLGNIARVDTCGARNILDDCEFTLATDVTNLLFGDEGATAVYAPQKNATEDELRVMERGMRHAAELFVLSGGQNVADVAGAGAGGGVGAPLLAFGRAKVLSGIEAVLSAIDFDKKLDGCDLVITGEGRLDRQSLYGKAVGGVCAAARKRGVPVAVVAGSVAEDVRALMGADISLIVALSDFEPDTEKSMKNAADLLERAGEKIAGGLSGKDTNLPIS